MQQRLAPLGAEADALPAALMWREPGKTRARCADLRGVVPSGAARSPVRGIGRNRRPEARMLARGMTFPTTKRRRTDGDAVAAISCTRLTTRDAGVLRRPRTIRTPTTGCAWRPISATTFLVRKDGIAAVTGWCGPASIGTWRRRGSQSPFGRASARDRARNRTLAETPRERIAIEPGKAPPVRGFKGRQRPARKRPTRGRRFASLGRPSAIGDAARRALVPASRSDGNSACHRRNHGSQFDNMLKSSRIACPQDADSVPIARLR